MSTRDRRSQRIRDQLRAHANPRSGQATGARGLHDQLKRVYGGPQAEPTDHDTSLVASELARLVRRRR